MKMTFTHEYTCLNQVSVIYPFHIPVKKKLSVPTTLTWKKCREQEEKVYFLAVVAVYETITEEPWATFYSGHTPLLHKSQVTTACPFLAQLSMMCQW